MHEKHKNTRKQTEYCLEMMRRIRENIMCRTARMNDDSYVNVLIGRMDITVINK